MAIAISYGKINPSMNRSATPWRRHQLTLHTTPHTNPHTTPHATRHTTPYATPRTISHHINSNDVLRVSGARHRVRHRRRRRVRPKRAKVGTRIIKAPIASEWQLLDDDHLVWVAAACRWSLTEDQHITRTMKRTIKRTMTRTITHSHLTEERDLQGAAGVNPVGAARNSRALG